jgi:hypothetical protein
LEEQLDQFKVEVEKLLSDSLQYSVRNINPLKEAKEIFERVGNVFEYDKVNDILVEIMTGITEMQKKVPIVMASYLWLYEGAYTFCINFFCSLLIQKGHDLFDPFNKNYVFSFKEIQAVETATKLKFLKCHNLEIFDRKEDKKLRNKIAHHDFVLDNSGVLKIDGKNINIVEKYENLLKFILTVFQVYANAQKLTSLRNSSQNKS